MKVFELVSKNDFTKIYKSYDIELFISKAYDEDEKKHFLIHSIPEIPEVGVARIQFPLVFDDEKSRDDVFDGLTEADAAAFIESLITEIKSRKQQQEQPIDPQNN
jgi:hypothetical protein